MIKFSILAGVSSDAQAHEDKASIPDQLKTCRATIEQLGGEEIGCYIMDGYTRTGYDSLADAMNDIPPLKEAIEAAARNEYDVLLMDNWDRLGDLGQLVHTRYKKYKKQIYSARQSGRLHDPATYDPYNDESAGIDMHIQAILQQYRLNKLRRGWKLGIPNRIRLGLVPFRVGYGFTRVDSKTPPVQNDNARYVIMMKDWLLEGRAHSWIAQQLDELGAPVPGKGKRWHVESIRHILLNPFYCGIVAIGQKRPEMSKKHKRYRQRTPQSDWTAGPGGHEPLWDEDTYLAIQNEYARRATLKNYSKVVYPLAGVLRCSVCEQKLIRRRVGRGGQLVPGLGCKHGESHIRLEYDQAIQLVGDALQKEIHDRAYNPVSKEEEEKRLQTKLDELKDERASVQEGYRAKVYNAAEASELVQDIERREKSTKQELENLQRIQQSRSEIQIAKAGLAKLDELASWMRDDDPVFVNQVLSMLFKTIVISPDCHVHFVYEEV